MTARGIALAVGGSGLGYGRLYSIFSKGLRNGNWRGLNSVEKALYMASLWLAKRRGILVNSRLLLQLRAIIGKLTETPGARAMGGAYRRASELYRRFSEAGVFEWAPQVRSWFNDPSYILWVGLCSPEPLLG